MRQLILDPASGTLDIRHVPAPQPGPGKALVRVAASVISTGTELSRVSLAKKPLWDKAKDRPEQVAKVIQGIGSEGIVATLQKVQERLASPMPLGYSLAGFVQECGDDCGSLQVGTRVACAGSSASHAEAVVVPATLTVPVPESVSLADAAFTTLGAIAMHGVRTGGVQLGDRVLIIGLGLLGQIATRLCVAAGAHVFGVDPRLERAQLAVDSGAEAAHMALDSATARAVSAWSADRGADVVLVTAGGSDNSPLVLAGEAARDRAKVVVVGAVDLTIPRETYYHKELSLVVSRSYGPGRYDSDFEERGISYPVGFVPWTERRNMEEFLSLLESGKLKLDGLHGATVRLDDAPDAYNLLLGDASPISVVIDYPETAAQVGSTTQHGTLDVNGRASNHFGEKVLSFEPRPLHLSMIGVGNFASGTLLPAIRSVEGVTLVRCIASSPLRADSIRQRWKFAESGTDASLGWAPDTQIVFIATRHDSHATFAAAALRANRAVFVEKPLALNPGELAQVSAAIHGTAGRLMVGFNRRFAPATLWALEQLGPDRGNLRFLVRVNAGPLPADHWLLDRSRGGGRLLGEACHFIDLACLVAAAKPVEILARARDRAGAEGLPQDFVVEITFANGATSAIEYVSSGDATLAKERFEIHRQGLSLVIDDFKRGECHRAGKVSRQKWMTRDKGHRSEVRAFLEAVSTGGATPIPEEDSIQSTALTLAAARSMVEGRPLRSHDW